MTSPIKNIAARVFRALPMLGTFAVLAGVAYVGHHTGWKIPSASAVFGREEPKKEGWCVEHGAPEATCIICRGLKVTATPPSEQSNAGKKPSGSGEPAVEEPPVTEGKPRPVVQVPSAGVMKAVGVETAPVQTRAMVESVEANAESGYDMTRYAQVASRAPGSAVAVRVQAGQHVKRGDVLALIDAAEVGKAKAEFLQAGATLASRRAVLERIKTSTAAGFRNQADLVTAEAEVKEAGIRAYNARQALGNLGLPTSSGLDPDAPPSEREIQFLGIPADVVAGLDPATATASLLPVAAPLDGVVISQSVVAGEVVDPARPLFVVADTGRVWVTAEVPPAQAALVRIGQEMSFIPDGWTGEPFAGKVSWISTEVGEKTRTVRVRAELDNPEGRLRAHAFGRARIEVRSTPAALAVPEDAVQPDGPAFLVFVRLNAEVFRPRIVTIGARSGGYAQVLSGLSPGEIIATTGSYFLASQANRAKLGAGCADD